MDSKIKVAIIDYQLSNLFSVKHACEYVGLTTTITSDPNLILSSDIAILPGVGAFKDAMLNLKRLNLVDPIKSFVASKRPFMGVCLGFQLLFEESNEFGQHDGLGIIKGRVSQIPVIKNGNDIRRVPHMGWSKISLPINRNSWNNTGLKNVKVGEHMYFVHSYVVQPTDKLCILSLTNYEEFEFCSAIEQNNIFAVQFHPEKSGVEGLKIYHNLTTKV